MTKIGKFESIHVRELWKHEERGFSKWLEENLEVLSDALGIPLAEPRRENSAGSFSCDILCDGPNGESVVIENQLEPTNHDHLGKILTYLSNLDAKVAVWIATSPRPEHIRAIQWLNETTPADVSFYLVRLDAFRISGSEQAAPLFTVIVQPSVEAKNIGREKKELAERHVRRLRFWAELLEAARKQGVNLHAQRSPSTDHWLSAGAGVRSGVSFTYLVLKNQTSVELYLDTPSNIENKKIFDFLFSHKKEIEANFSKPLQWERLDDKKSSRIRYALPGGGLLNEDQWPEIQARMIQAMSKLAIALKPFLDQM